MPKQTREARENERRAYRAETVLLYATGKTEPQEDRVTDLLADLGHLLGADELERLAARAARHVRAEQHEATIQPKGEHR
jgi:hypothetical protein